MKTLLKALYEIGLSIGQAKTAAALARAGHIDQAKALMLAK